METLRENSWKWSNSLSVSGLSVDCHENKDNKGRGGSVMAPPILPLGEISLYFFIRISSRKEKNWERFKFIKELTWLEETGNDVLCNYLKKLRST